MNLPVIRFGGHSFCFGGRGFYRLAVLALAVSGLAFFASAPAPAQVPASQTTSYGSVTGRVMCSDTQTPARFAQVMLTPAAEVTGDEDFGRGRREATRTGLDGEYLVSNVPAGDYYVTATATGYVSEAAAIQEGLNAGADLQTLLAKLPIVHVSAGGSSTANVTLDRGATIAGEVLWDDGSAAAGVLVAAIAPPAASATPASTSQTRAPREFGNNSSGYGTTDDRGHFRLTGLAAGNYIVRASIPLPASIGIRGGFGGNSFGGPAMAFYAPGKVRETDAKPLTLHPAEEHDDTDITLDLSALHTVSGHVSSASDSLTLGSGTIRITDQTDPTLTRSATIAPDGSFTLTYVPSGAYTLSVPYAASTSAVGTGGGGFFGRGGYRRSASSFQPLTQTLSVAQTDVSGLAIALTPVTASSATASQP